MPSKKQQRKTPAAAQHSVEMGDAMYMLDDAPSSAGPKKRTFRSSIVSRHSSFLQADDAFDVAIDEEGLEVHTQKRTATFTSTCVLAIAEVVGIGVLGLPHTVSQLGWVWAVVFMAGLGNLSVDMYLKLDDSLPFFSQASPTLFRTLYSPKS